MARTSTRDLILEAAIVAAARHGITGASMDEIADVAGVAKGSLYYNFSSKDAIFGELLQDGIGRLARAIDVARERPSGAPIRDVALAVLATLQANPDLARVIAAEVFRADRPWREAVLHAREAVAVRLRDLLRECARAGTDPETITETSGAALFGAILAAALDWLLTRPELPVEAVADQALYAVLG